MLWSAAAADRDGGGPWRVERVSALVGHSGRITSIRWIPAPAGGGAVRPPGGGNASSPAAQLIATASTDKTVRVWNARDASCAHVLSGAAGAVPQIGVAAVGGERLVIGAACNNGSACAYALDASRDARGAPGGAAARAVRDELPREDGWACSHASPVAAEGGGAFLLTAMVHPEHNEGRLQYWDLRPDDGPQGAGAGGAGGRRRPRRANGKLTRPVFSIDGIGGRATHLLVHRPAQGGATTAVLLTADGTLRVIDVDGGSIVASRHEIHPLPATPHGTRFSAAVSAAIVRAEVRGGAGGGSSVLLLATGGKDGMVRVWRLACDDGGDSEGLLALELSMGGDCAMSLAWITGCAGGSRAAGRPGGGADGGGIMLACGGDAGALTVFDVGSHLDM